MRGDIWYVSSKSTNAELGAHRSVGCEIWPNKYAVIVSNDRLNETSGFVQIVYISTAKRRSPNRLHAPVVLPPSTGRNTLNAVAFCEQVHAVDMSRLRNYYGEVTDDELDGIDEAILWSLDLAD